MEKKAKHTTAILLSVIFVCAFIILIYLLEIRKNPFFENPITDSLWHDQWGWQIAMGNDYLGNIAFFRAPFYPYFLALIYFLFGHNYFIPRLIQIIIASLSCLLIFLIGKYYFNKKVGFAAAAIAVLYGPFIYYDCELLITTLFTFLTLLTVYLIIIAINKKKWWWFFPGISLGLAAIARPTILILVPGVIILWLLHREKLDMKITVCSFFAGMIIMIAPITVRNYIAEKDFVLISSQGGINYFIGNNPLSDGKTAKAPSMDKPPTGVQDHIWYSSVKVAEREMGKPLKSSEVSNYWFSRGIGYLFKSPFQFLQLQLKKCYYYINAFEIESNLSIYQNRKYSLIFRILVWIFGIAFPFGLVFPLSILGMFWYRKRWRDVYLLYYIIIFYSLSVVIFFVTSRFRIPVVPFFIIFTAYAIIHLIERLKINKNKKWIISMMGALIVIGLITNSSFLNVREINHQREYYLTGYAYARQGNYSQAIKELNTSLKFPVDPLIQAQVYYILGDIYCVRKQYGAAEKAYIAALRNNPQHAKVYFQLGNLYMILGYLERAEYAYHQALRIYPDYHEAKVNLKLLLQKKR